MEIVVWMGVLISMGLIFVGIRIYIGRKPEVMNHSIGGDSEVGEPDHDLYQKFESYNLYEEGEYR